MADYSLFVTEQEIKDTTMLNDNVDEKLIRFGLENAQDTHILPIIGSGLFDELQTQINAGTTTALNTTLLTEMRKTVIWFTLYELHPFLNFKYFNKAIVQRQAEEIQPVSKGEMDYLAEYVKNRAEMYADRFRKWLIENEDDYPLYTNPGSATDTIYPTKDVFDIGINLTRFTETGSKEIKSKYDIGDCE